MNNSIKDMLKRPMSVAMSAALAFGMGAPVLAAGAMAPVCVQQAVAAEGDVTGARPFSFADTDNANSSLSISTETTDAGIVVDVFEQSGVVSGDENYFGHDVEIVIDGVSTDSIQMASAGAYYKNGNKTISWSDVQIAKAIEFKANGKIVSIITFTDAVADTVAPTTLSLKTPGSELVAQAEAPAIDYSSITQEEFSAACDQRTNEEFEAFLESIDNSSSFDVCPICGYSDEGCVENGELSFFDHLWRYREWIGEDDSRHWSDWTFGGANFPCPALVYTSMDDISNIDTANSEFVKWVYGASAAPALVSYTAIKIFDADIEGAYDDEDAPKASNLVFGNGVNHATIDPDATEVEVTDEEGNVIGTKYIVTIKNADGEDVELDISNPQNAAEYIASQIAHTPGEDMPAGWGLDFARRVIEDGAATETVYADADEAVTLDGSGYYLIVKTDVLEGENTAASTPIFAALKSGENTIYLKTAIPSLTKELKEDADGEWGTKADHALNDVVDYRIIATMPENIDSYDKYTVKISDSYSADALTLDGNIAVTVDGHDVTGQVSITRDDEAGTFVVLIENLKGLTYVNDDDETVAIAIDADTEVLVTYSAHQSGDAASPDGVKNNATFEYSNNPVVEDSFGSTPTVTTEDYSYAMRIFKTDNATGEALDGVKFSIKSTDEDGTVKYLMIEDGKLVERALAEGEEIPTFTTGVDPVTGEAIEKGMILLNGVDGDEYVVVEEDTIDSYVKLTEDEFITVTPVETADVKHASALVSSTTNLVSGADADDALVQINVKNIKQVQLPSTGEAGLALLILVAGAFAVRAIVNRRKADDYKIMTIE